MKIRYVVTDAGRYRAEPAWCAGSFDHGYYRGLLEAAWDEIRFAFGRKGKETWGRRGMPALGAYG